MVNIQYQQRIESTLSMVPVGVVVSYGQLADLAGLPGKARLIALQPGALLCVQPRVPPYVLRATGPVQRMSGCRRLP